MRYYRGPLERMTGSRITKTYPRESLGQAVGAILRQELIALFALWLSIGFPILCQQHGLMSVFDLDTHVHPAEPGLVSDLALHVGHELSQSADPLTVQCSVTSHSSAPLMTMTLSGLIALIPLFELANQNVKHIWVRLPSCSWPLQLTASLLDEPPRWL